MARRFSVEVLQGEMRATVSSSSDEGGRHMVDFLSYYGNGECSCMDFTVVCKRNIDKAQEGRVGEFRQVPYCGPDGRNPDRTQCVHVAAARHYWTTVVFRHILSTTNQ